MEKKLGIIRRVYFGLNDGTKLGLTFSIYIDEYTASDQAIYDYELIERMLIDTNVGNVYDLNNKPCWVECDRFTMKFISMMKLD